MDNTNGVTKSYTDTNSDHSSRVLPLSTTAYTAGVAQGDAPITTLHQQGHSTQSSVAARRAKVQREIDEALAKYSQASQKYVPIHNSKRHCYAMPLLIAVLRGCTL
ncbi:hypothetical protein F4821DRAFT_176079 [Hypoxylon rubiginosum]|uniref:Uncharacterized protein n=1 Tax=Hypoxylon rubiginosum TaxID=110542 RepID=A0ACC0CUW1_9PEZI|nr:hypothetical protein F4821DRAFT_176079 [Hypoxylon rubiginosum]